MSFPTPEQHRWFTDEVHPHGPSLKAYLRGAFPAVRDVDDVVQESYLRVWRARLAQPIRSGKSFLFQVARHVALNFVRKCRNAPFADGVELAIVHVPDDHPDAYEALVHSERFEFLADALMTLPPRCREITFLCKVQGLPQNDVAAQLGLSKRTVETQVRVGVTRCHAYLRARGVIPDHENEI